MGGIPRVPVDFSGHRSPGSPQWPTRSSGKSWSSREAFRVYDLVQQTGHRGRRRARPLRHQHHRTWPGVCPVGSTDWIGLDAAGRNAVPDAGVGGATEREPEPRWVLRSEAERAGAGANARRGALLRAEVLAVCGRPGRSTTASPKRLISRVGRESPPRLGLSWRAPTAGRGSSGARLNCGRIPTGRSSGCSAATIDGPVLHRNDLSC